MNLVELWPVGVLVVLGLALIGRETGNKEAGAVVGLAGGLLLVLLVVAVLGVAALLSIGVNPFAGGVR